MKLPLAYYGNPVLRKKGVSIETITDEIRQLVQNMEETMIAHNGIGLAAPQVSRSLALFITCADEDEEDDENEEDTEEEHSVSKKKSSRRVKAIKPPPVTKVYINPKIISYSDDLWACSQGCLSIPTVYGTVIRPMSIKIEATDLEGNRFTEELSKLPAHAFMHENDHINGVLFIDRISAKEKKEIEPLLRKVKKDYGNSY